MQRIGINSANSSNSAQVSDDTSVRKFRLKHFSKIGPVLRNKTIITRRCDNTPASAILHPF